MPNDGMPAREQERQNEAPCDERVAAVCDDRQEVGETPDENLETAVSDYDDSEENEECMEMSMYKLEVYLLTSPEDLYEYLMKQREGLVLLAWKNE